MKSYLKVILCFLLVFILTTTQLALPADASYVNLSQPSPVISSLLIQRSSLAFVRVSSGIEILKKLRRFISGERTVIKGEKVIVRGQKTVATENGRGKSTIKRRRMTNLEKGIIESGKTVKFSGHNFVKRDALFNPKLADATGKSNVERMIHGLPPIGKDGKQVELHHMKQESNGTIAEISYTQHTKDSGILHRYLGKNKSEIDRNEFNKLRARYWKERAKDFG
jgi:hypothetical protein